MPQNTIPSLVALPVELIFRILDHLDFVDILISVRGVCGRLNTITDAYHPYQVKYVFALLSALSHSISSSFTLGNSNYNYEGNFIALSSLMLSTC